MIYFINVFTADVCIGAGEALINSVCVDCWKLGQEVGLDLKSCVKCSDLKVFSPRTLSCEYCDLSSIFIQNECVCDKARGFVNSSGQCINCYRGHGTQVAKEKMHLFLPIVRIGHFASVFIIITYLTTLSQLFNCKPLGIKIMGRIVFRGEFNCQYNDV
ncbi:Hypothetical_protein [Hexamita inflata]|uniref:Hypothetical_protein n=1 Tax=Hexamita inflata TaxID=28002 RepID=A0ABP1HYS2_9EUKA